MDRLAELRVGLEERCVMQDLNRILGLAIAISAILAPGGSPGFAQSSFLAFESGQVRPLALTPDGERLFAVNTPDGHLEVFRVTGTGLQHEASVPVGLEPVAAAVRGNDEVWVVNFLSDSVSIVDVAADPPQVVRTLLVGDEPRDIVFAGPGERRAFVTTAHRGQHRTHRSLAGVPGAGDPQLTTPGVPRADVWVFDAERLGETLGGTPLEIVELFGDTPRALATSPDGKTVYTAVFHSGNQTTALPAGIVCEGFEPDTPCTIEGTEVPGGNPGPPTNHEKLAAPHVGLVVQFDRQTGQWRDELGRDWTSAVRFDLPDYDVFAINAATLEPIEIFSHVGTTLFNMAVNPVSGTVYVSNTEAINDVRFEGPGKFFDSTVQGHLAETRITVLADGDVSPRHLNKHIDYSQRPAPAGTRQHSLATPLDLAVSSDGSTLYVAAFGSSKVGVFATSSLEDDSFDPTVESANYIAVSGGGPSGLALDDARKRLYVLTRFDNSISVVDLATGSESAHVALHNPEPAAIVAGRPFLYDAVATSSNGEAACASCHIFGDMDHLAWDLGDPDGDVADNPIPIKFNPLASFRTAINGTGETAQFHPMKGPMTTQTLRGMASSGAMHWRGDRSVGALGSDPFDADLSFRNFIVAFVGLVGRETQISAEDMQKFSDFALRLTLPPNPVRALDNSLTKAQKNGRDFYFGRVGGSREHRSDGLPTGAEMGFTCQGCHTLDPANGFFGTDGNASFEGLPQIFKIPHLRNMVQKVGMFGNPAVPDFIPGDNDHQGAQVRGFGFLHDGSVDTVLRFFHIDVLNSEDPQVGFFRDQQRRDVEQFMLAFDSDLPPIAGQQVTLSRAGFEVKQRVELMVRAAGRFFPSKLLGPGARECDLVVWGTVDGEHRGWLYDPTRKRFLPDRTAEPPLTHRRLRSLSAKQGQPLTYTCAPFGSGRRMALDRDQDGAFNRDELDAGTDPADPASR